MKKITLLAILFSAVAFTSCSKDNATSTNTNGVSTGDYYPMKEGNQWTMKVDTIPAVTSSIIETDVFGGSTYYKLSNSLMGSDVGVATGIDMQTWVTKKGASYITKTGDVNISESGMTIKMTGFEMTVLRDDLAVGGTWTQTIPLTMTMSDGTDTETIKMTTKYTGTILEKAASATVNGVVYQDVIKVSIKEIITAVDPTTGESQSDETDEEDWYAKGVGPIKSMQTSDGTTTESDLTSYLLK